MTHRLTEAELERLQGRTPKPRGPKYQRKLPGQETGMRRPASAPAIIDTTHAQPVECSGCGKSVTVTVQLAPFPAPVRCRRCAK